MIPITKQAAREAGLKRYFTGAPCKYGHVAERYLDGTCAACSLARANEYYVKNKERVLKKRVEEGRRYRELNRAKRTEAARAWRALNRDKVRTAAKARRARNLEKLRAEGRTQYFKHHAAARQRNAEYLKRNSDRAREYVSNRRAARLQRTPSWLTPEDRWVFKEAHELALLREKMMGFPWHVDHIVPLRGATVSGLHVPWNIQVIPAVVNCSKGNRLLEAEK